jgi:drug/metabolite transporter (DMT)-like permease
VSAELDHPPNVRPNHRIAFGLLITTLGGILYSFDLPLLKLAASDKWTMIFVRGLMLFLSITAVWYLTAKLTGRREAYIAGGTGLAVVATSTLANISYVAAAVETHTANVVFIIAFVPILTALFSRVFLKEKIHGYTWLAAMISVVGVAIIVVDSWQSEKYLGDILAFISACCTAASFTIVRYGGKNVATSLAMGSLLASLIAVAFFPVNLAGLLSPAGFSQTGLLWLCINGLIAIPLASILVSNGPRYLPAVDVSMFFMLETVLAPVWIWLLFGDAPSPAVTWGGLIIIVTLLIHSFWRWRNSSHIADISTRG